MKQTNFYVCPNCGNVITAMADAAISCCGKKLKAIEPQKAADEEKLNAEIADNQLYITADHPMTKEHYIAFVALLTGDSLILKKQYPEWDLQAHIPDKKHRKLLWYCTQHGLFYQNV